MPRSGRLSKPPLTARRRPATMAGGTERRAMARNEKQRPGTSAAGRDRADERQRRLAKALRENLKKRRSQVRARGKEKPA